MAAKRCSCGFTEAAGTDETISDHLLHMFTPEDDKDPAGQVHLEGTPQLTCLCGFQASTAAELDSHFLEVFVPTNAMDSAGVEHTVIA